MSGMYFNKEQFNKCLDFIEQSLVDYLECSISLQPSLNDEDKEDLIDVCNQLNAVKLLRRIKYDDYVEETSNAKM